MKIKYFIAISLLLFCVISCKSGDFKNVDPVTGKATLVFRASQEEMSVYIYKPIDDMYNYHYITEKFDIKPNISINYELDVNDFAFVKCRFSNGFRGEYLLFPGDCVEINYEPRAITISGSNADGHSYLMDNYVNRGLGYYADIIRQHITVPINYDSVYDFFHRELFLSCQTDLKKMEMSGSITPRFSSILAKNIYAGISAYSFLSIYQYSLEGSKPIEDNFTPSEEHFQQVLLHLNRLYETLDAMSGDVKKMHYSTSRYYRLKYHYLDDETKEKLTEGYDKDTFGDTPYLLLASDSTQLREFGNYLIYDLQSIKPFYNYNQKKLLVYLSNKFPDSEYVAIIKQLMIKNQSAKANDEVVFIDDSPSSIQEMMQLSGIKGKYVYIDLWALWCGPCIAEFTYNDEIHQLLTQYSNIVPVYISIDKENERELWKNGVNQFNLKGYHILASKSLNEDFGTKVYHANEIGSIPRYLLLDPEGNIVNDNLPRKSRVTELRPIFAGLPK